MPSSRTRHTEILFYSYIPPTTSDPIVTYANVVDYLVDTNVDAPSNQPIYMISAPI